MGGVGDGSGWKEMPLVCSGGTAGTVGDGSGWKEIKYINLVSGMICGMKNHFNQYQLHMDSRRFG